MFFSIQLKDDPKDDAKVTIDMRQVKCLTCTEQSTARMCGQMYVSSFARGQ